MGEPVSNNPFEAFFTEIRRIVREEIAKALENGRTEKLLYSTKEAAQKIGCEESWLAGKARAGLVPYRMLGHYRYFSMADIKNIIDKSYMPMVHIGNKGQGVSPDTKAAQVESSQVGESHGDYGDDGSAMGEG